MTPDEKACLQDGNKARIYEQRKAKEKEKETRKINKFFRVMCIIKKCKEQGKYDLALKLISKYNINKKTLEEAYYD